MKPEVYNVSKKYQLWVHSIPNEMKISIGVRLSEGTFSPLTNTATVLMDPIVVRMLIADLQERLDEIS